MNTENNGETFDLAVIGAGIVGLAHALAASRLGMRVIVVDRDARASGASVRNFGFVTVTGQEQRVLWPRARRSRDVWSEVAAATGLCVDHRNLAVVAQSIAALEVLAEFADSPMGERCELLDALHLRGRLPMLREQRVFGGLWSPHELRVEPRVAIPALADWLAEAWGVTFKWSHAVRSIALPTIETTTGTIQAHRAIVCPGNDLLTLYPDVIARHGTTHCKLQMLRLGPQPGGWRLPTAIMSDLGLVRYEGYAEMPSLPAPRAQLAESHAAALDAGVHLIVVQAQDGSLVIGDSHIYDETPDPFQSAAVDDIVLDVAHATLNIPNPQIVERWTGMYPYSPSTPTFVEAPEPNVRVVLVTGGTGMSTSFGLAEEVVSELVSGGTGLCC